MESHAEGGKAFYYDTDDAYDAYQRAPRRGHNAPGVVRAPWACMASCFPPPILKRITNGSPPIERALVSGERKEGLAIGIKEGGSRNRKGRRVSQSV